MGIQGIATEKIIAEAHVVIQRHPDMGGISVLLGESDKSGIRSEVTYNHIETERSKTGQKGNTEIKIPVFGFNIIKRFLYIADISCEITFALQW